MPALLNEKSIEIFIELILHYENFSRTTELPHREF